MQLLDAHDRPARPGDQLARRPRRAVRRGADRTARQRLVRLPHRPRLQRHHHRAGAAAAGGGPGGGRGVARASGSWATSSSGASAAGLRTTPRPSRSRCSTTPACEPRTRTCSRPGHHEEATARPAARPRARRRTVGPMSPARPACRPASPSRRPSTTSTRRRSAAGAVPPGDVMFGAGTAWVLLARRRPRRAARCPSSRRRSSARTSWTGSTARCVSMVNGGSAFGWARRLAGPAGRQAARSWTAWLRASRAGSAGVRFWPFLASAGAGLPPEVRGRLAGLALSHGPAHVLRAVVEGLSWSWRAIWASSPARGSSRAAS